jgi:hypothetical protein
LMVGKQSRDETSRALFAQVSFDTIPDANPGCLEAIADNRPPSERSVRTDMRTFSAADFIKIST